MEGCRDPAAASVGYGLPRVATVDFTAAAGKVALFPFRDPACIARLTAQQTPSCGETIPASEIGQAGGSRN
jgi:hypothetical protein